MDDIGRYKKGKSGRDRYEAVALDPVSKLRFVELSHVWGHGGPISPGDPEIRIERGVTHARDGVLSQKITMNMHNSTHMNAPIHLVQGGGDIASLSIDKFFGNGVVLGIPKKRWELVTADDLAKATPAVQQGDIVVINTGWHAKFSDSQEYFGCAPGLSKDAAEWLISKKVALVALDTPAIDHPLATSLGLHRNGPLMKRLPQYYRDQTGRDPKQDFPDWNPAHNILLRAGIPTIENAGGGLDLVTGQRCTIHACPWRFQFGDACIIRLMAIVDQDGSYRVESGK